jgi:hypothetical protein
MGLRFWASFFAKAADFKLEPDAPFTDLRTNETGRGCTLTATGTGLTFPGQPGETGAKLMGAFEGWTAVTDADVYAGGGSEAVFTAMTRASALMVLQVGWDPTPDAAAKCTGQPIGACDLKPEQKQYTVQIQIAQK